MHRPPIRYHERPVPRLNHNCPRWMVLLCVVALVAALTAATPALGAKKTISDDLLYDRVNRKLITDPDLGTRQLQVQVSAGQVTVTGFVETEKHRKKVPKVVKKVKGVQSVDNQVRIQR